MNYRGKGEGEKGGGGCSPDGISVSKRLQVEGIPAGVEGAAGGDAPVLLLVVSLSVAV